MVSAHLSLRLTLLVIIDPVAVVQVVGVIIAAQETIPFKAQIRVILAAWFSMKIIIGWKTAKRNLKKMRRFV